MPLLRRPGTRQMGVLTASSPYVNNSKQQCQATCAAHDQQQQDNCLHYNRSHNPILHSVPVSTVVLMFTNTCSSYPHYTLAAPTNITGMSHEHLKSPATQLFAQYIVKVYLKGIVKHLYDCVFVTGNVMTLSWLSIWASHYRNVISWRIKSPATRLFVQQFVQGNHKGNINVSQHWPFVRRIHPWPVV